MNLQKGDVGEVMQEALNELKNKKNKLTPEEEIEWEFLTALSIDCGSVANRAYKDLAGAVPCVERAIRLLSSYPLEQRYAFEILCYTKLINMYIALEKTELAVRAIEENIKIHEKVREREPQDLGFERIYNNDSRFYYNLYVQMLFLPDLPSEQLEKYFAKFLKLQETIKVRDRSYWDVNEIYYTSKKNFKKALECNDSAISYTPKYFRPTDLVSPYLSRVSLYEQLGDYKNAFYCLMLCDSIRETLHSQEIKQSMNEMRTRFDFDKLTLEKMNSDDSAKDTLIIAVVIILLCVITWGIRQHLMVRRLRKAKDDLLKSNEEVKKQSLKVGESEKMKTAFIDFMCHEIRTPLDAINGFTDLYLTTDMDEMTKAELQKQIQENTNQLTGLLNAILELSVLVSSGETLVSEPTDVYDICLQQMDMLKIRNMNQNVKCIFQGAPCPCTFYSNEFYFSKVISNLLDNAAKFTTKGKIVLNCAPNIEERCMEISVTDTGVGISPDKQKWVFERFTKVDAFVPGAGLGLYLCKLVINKLGGTIEVDSTYKEGCRIVIVLPCQSTLH